MSFKPAVVKASKSSSDIPSLSFSGEKRKAAAIVGSDSEEDRKPDIIDNDGDAVMKDTGDGSNKPRARKSMRMSTAYRPPTAKPVATPYPTKPPVAVAKKGYDLRNRNKAKAEVASEPNGPTPIPVGTSHLTKPLSLSKPARPLARPKFKKPDPATPIRQSDVFDLAAPASSPGLPPVDKMFEKARETAKKASPPRRIPAADFVSARAVLAQSLPTNTDYEDPRVFALTWTAPPPAPQETQTEVESAGELAEVGTGGFPEVENAGEFAEVEDTQEDEQVVDGSAEHGDTVDEQEGIKTPHLPNLAQLPSIPLNAWAALGGDDVYSTTTFYYKLVKHMDPANLHCFDKGREFIKQGRFVNLANINPSKLIKGKNWIQVQLEKNKDTVVCIMLGVVGKCNLINPSSTQEDDDMLVKHIAIVPLHSDTTRFARSIASLFHYTSLRVPFLAGAGLCFATKRATDEEQDEYENTGTVASQIAGAYNQIRGLDSPKPAGRRDEGGLISARPTKKQAGSSNKYPVTKVFSDDVPIYDGRASRGRPFSFSLEEFDSIDSRPQWKNGLEDLVVNKNVVAVAFTISTWDLKERDKKPKDKKPKVNERKASTSASALDDSNVLHSPELSIHPHSSMEL
ncbi:hypothetical protein BDN72DRAFT_905786 [Pluteus cervinus]|uniref:Uncharacterized protein n=1 Tax=Pluteus cervinus TaxID=181527 RepID=A0ACD3A1G5_9AGAR|nr:hypothetical protein BDN72DRAFT_905786 [Pluteus cervinus]